MSSFLSSSLSPRSPVYRSCFSRPLLWAALSVLPVALSGCGGDEKFASSNATTGGTTASGTGSNTTAQNASPVTTVSATEPASQPGKYGGKLTAASISDPKTFNLWVASETGSTGAVGPLSDSLIGQNSYTLKYEMRLAESEQVSPDGLTWTYKLRPGLKWSDGQPLNADDVIFTMTALYDPKVQTNLREGLTLDAPDGKGGFKRVPLGYRKVDDRTVEFKFPVRYAPARSILSFPIAPRHKLETAYKAGQPANTQFNSAYGINTPVQDVVSCGAWVLTEYKAGQRLVYKRNPYYWKKGVGGKALPYLDEYVTLIVPDANTTTLKFRAGDTDVISPLPLTDYPSIKAGEAQGNYKVTDVGPSWGNSYLSLNQNLKSKPAKDNPELIELFRDVRFRQALSSAINRERITQSVYNGLAKPMYGPESPANTAFFKSDLKTFPYDLNKAKELLAQIGLKDSDNDGVMEYKGKPVKFNILTNVENNQRKTTATIISDDLKKIGLGVTFTPVSFLSLTSRLNPEPQPGKPYPPYDWQAIILGFTGGPEPNSGRNIWNSSGNLHQWNPYQKTPDTAWEKEIDTIFREGAQELDEAKRKALYQKFQSIAAEQLPLIYTVVPDSVSALRNGYGNVKACSLGGVTWNLDELYSLKATRDTP